MNIVHQIGDALYEALPYEVAHKHFVKARQATNDIAIDFAKKLIKQQITKAKEEERTRIRGVIEGLEQTSRNYSDGIASHVRSYNLALTDILKEIGE